MFVKEVFQLVKPLQLCILPVPKNAHICMYSMTPTFFISFFAHEHQKYADFYADFKPVEIIGKIAPRKSYLPKPFASREEDKLQFCMLFLPTTFL